MVPVDADLFESVGYVTGARQLYIKFRNAPHARCSQPCAEVSVGESDCRSAPRKDVYYKTFIQNLFISKPVELPPTKT